MNYNKIKFFKNTRKSVHICTCSHHYSICGMHTEESRRIHSNKNVLQSRLELWVTWILYFGFCFYCLQGTYIIWITHTKAVIYKRFWAPREDQWENFEARDLLGHPQHCSRRGTWPQNSALQEPLSKITQALVCNFCSGSSIVPAYQMRPAWVRDRESQPQSLCGEKNHMKT